MLRAVVVLCLVAVAVAGPPVTRRRSEIEEFRNFLESTRTVNGLRASTDPQYGSVWENSGKFEGDILLDDEQVEELVEEFSTGRAAYIRPNTRWPGRVIPYEFASGHFTANQRNTILNAMRALESRTCISFRARRFREQNYALITGYPWGCYATVGFSTVKGVHTINLATPSPAGQGCLNFVVIIHEWLHVIGFFHMQSAYTRYNYVRINWQNIRNGAQHNFYQMRRDISSQLGLPYEHASCMHYSSHAFSNNGRPTIEATRPHNGVMGQLEHVTGWDLMRVDRHYGCAAWRTEKDYKPITHEDFMAEFKNLVDETEDIPVNNEEFHDNKEDVPENEDEVSNNNETPEFIEEKFVEEVLEANDEEDILVSETQRES